MLLSELALTSETVAATSRRGVKIDKIAALLRAASPAEVPVVVAFLSGELLQRQIGVGYAALGDLRTEPATGLTVPSLTVTETDAVFSEVGAVTGSGTQAGRRRLLADLFGRATAAERGFRAGSALDRAPATAWQDAGDDPRPRKGARHRPAAGRAMIPP